MDKEGIFREIALLLKREGAEKIAVFGSAIRKREPRDIDVIVKFSKRKSLLELVRIERELSEAVKKKVDLLTEESISCYILEKVREEMEVIG
jgi:hypothetical protein